MMFMGILPLIPILLLVSDHDPKKRRSLSTELLVMLLVVPLLGGIFMMGGSGMMGWGYGGGANWLQMVLGVLLLCAVGWFIFAALRHRPATNDEALETLRMRLAKGEITPEEFNTLRTALTK